MPISFDPFFGKYSPGLFYIGVVQHEGGLKAEYGPKKFQTATDNFMSTALFSFEELREVFAHSKEIPWAWTDTLAYIQEIRAGLNELAEAQKALAAKLVNLDEFFKPEPVSHVEIDPKLPPLPLLKIFADALARLAKIAVDWDNPRIAIQFGKASDGIDELAMDVLGIDQQDIDDMRMVELASQEHYKPLPPQMLPRQP